MLKIALIFSLISSFLIFHIRQHAQMASIQRKMKLYSARKKELQSRNRALKNELAKIGRGVGSNTWQPYLDLAPYEYEKNKIVKIELPPPLRTNP